MPLSEHRSRVRSASAAVEAALSLTRLAACSNRATAAGASAGRRRGLNADEERMLSIRTTSVTSVCPLRTSFLRLMRLLTSLPQAAA
jgi:hypothetical protein